MAVQFILGRARSGKTRHLLGQMIEATKADPLGPPIFFLLPRQATFQAERLLTAELGAFSRIRVISFDQLGKDILTHCGDVGIPEVTALGRRMVIGHLLRRHQKQLKFYGQSAHRRGLAAELDDAFGEFERAGLDGPGLGKLVDDFHADDRTEPGLRDKLFDLHLLLQSYNQYIGQDRLDPQRRMTLILKRAAECSLFKQAQLFIDDFYDFTAHERRMVTALAGAVKSTTIALLIDPDGDAVKNPAGLSTDLSVFHRTERTYRALLNSFAQAGLQVVSPIIVQRSTPFPADLAAIEKSLFADVIEKASAQSIEAISAPDARMEVDAVARHIRHLVNDGMRYRQIGVLVRDLDSYHEIIHASFAEHGLPYFADRRRTAGHHPLLQMVRTALQIARHDWPGESVMTFIKTGLVGLTGDETDELENYVLQHRIRGRDWARDEPWRFSRDLIVADEETGEVVLSESARIDSLRRSIADRLAPLMSKQPRTVRDWAGEVFAMLEAFDVRATLRKWMDEAEAADELERRNEHEQIWAEFVALFDHMVDLLGAETISLTDLIDVLDSGLESFDLALTPVRVDQLLVGQVDRTRPPELKAVFVLGLNEGAFPRLQRERPIINDRERRMLRSRGNIDLDPDRQRRLLDERFLAYLAFTRPSERLIVSRTNADLANRESGPSLFWLKLLEIVPDIPVQTIARSFAPVIEQIGTPRQLATGLMRWVRSGAPADSQWPALYQWFVSHSEDDAVGAIRRQAWPALRYNNESHLSSALAKEMFAWPLQVNVRQLETAAECPFRHFARYGLQLRSREEPQVSTIDLSNAYHDILENLVADCLANNKDWCELKQAEIRDMIRIHVSEIGRRLRGALMLSSARNRHLLDRIEQNLQQVLETMCEIHRRGTYRPGFANIRFGKEGKLPAHAVKTPGGNEVQLHGQIDRVDLHKRKTAFVVDDYKMLAGGLTMDRLFHGLSMQLLTQLLVIEANAQELVGQKMVPAAAFFLQLLRSPEKVGHPSEAILPEDPNFPLRVKPRGIIEQRAVHSFDRNWATGPSAVIHAFKTTKGDLARANFSDAYEKSDLDALLRHVEKRIGELAEQIVSGDIAVAPYRIAKQSPCSRCEYRSVCRFEPGINRYRMLNAMKREEVLVAITTQR